MFFMLTVTQQTLKNLGIKDFADKISQFLKNSWRFSHDLGLPPFNFAHKTNILRLWDF